MRLEFARNNANWQIRQLRSVLFTEESKFCVDNKRRRMWRRRKERFNDCCVAQHDRFVGGSMVWGAISIQGSLSCTWSEMEHWPVWDIEMGFFTQLRDHLPGPWLQNLFWWMITRPYRANIVSQYLEAEPFGRMEWPSMSPDLNPIKHVWDVLKRHIQQRDPAPPTTNELEVALLGEWDRNAKRTIRSLIRSVPRRCRAVIQAKGRPHKVLTFVWSTDVF